ncbi:hypothetical protein [Cupriavidus sp. PET2-C1]
MLRLEMAAAGRPDARPGAPTLPGRGPGLLFQAEQPDVALLLAKVGYLFIIFLPTCFYHFVTEVTECRTEPDSHLTWSPCMR